LGLLSQVLDPALLRPGRINRRVVVPRPTEDGRRDILSVHLRTVPVDGDVGLLAAYVASVSQVTSSAE
jgi:cell division protease FtsH